MSNFSIPWSFLHDVNENHAPNSDSTSVKQPQKQQKTFVQAVNNVCDIPTNQLPKPCVKGNKISIIIPEDDYEAGIDDCKHCLHGRVIWPKGATPVSVVALRTVLASLWKSIGRWGITSLGKGYFEFSFSSVEDVRRVRAVNSWNLNPGFLKLFPWTKDFNPSVQKQTSAQVWVRIYGLSQEYWRPKILFAIASSVGTPLCTDVVTNKPKFDRTFGHFVRVLVDLDISNELSYEILVERKGFAFFVELEYENLPDYCSYCKNIGHNFDNCKKRVFDFSIDKEDLAKKKSRQEPKQIYVPVVGKSITEIVDLEVSNPKVGNIDTSNFVISPEPKSGTKSVEKVTSSIRRDSSGDSEMQMQAGSPILSEPVVIVGNEVIAPVLVDRFDNEPVHVDAIVLAKNPSVDSTPDLRIVGSWSDAVTDSDYIQDPPFWCGTTSSNVIASDVVINPHIAHDLQILRVWKDNEAGNIGHKTYTDEEENAAAINYLKNRSAAIEEPFIEVVSKAKKKNPRKGVQVHNTRSSGRR
ncbi:hypothetical protein QL285_040346 [Trifolium repens]|nr:hypothetical protein QL285_040336 [Trifolium repens]KAK2418119.1 hypothetical protein QL285_040346 [Trifolium repens]